MTRTLEFKWTVSRGRETYGYNICSLYVDGHKAASCNGGGYDMKGTAFGRWLAREYASRLYALKPEQMPEQSHWERADPTPRLCEDIECLIAHSDDPPQYEDTCKHCGGETRLDYHAGKRVDDGRYFYGLSFHIPNYDPGKATVDHPPVFGKEEDSGKTVDQLETEGKSFGLERYQAFYSASSHQPTDVHTVPLIDGACGFSSVEKIANAIGLRLEYVPVRSKKIDVYRLIDKQEGDN